MPVISHYLIHVCKDQIKHSHTNKRALFKVDRKNKIRYIPGTSYGRHILSQMYKKRKPFRKFVSVPKILQ